jgi:hypothetical protein
MEGNSVSIVHKLGLIIQQVQPDIAQFMLLDIVIYWIDRNPRIGEQMLLKENLLMQSSLDFSEPF